MSDAHAVTEDAAGRGLASDVFPTLPGSPSARAHGDAQLQAGARVGRYIILEHIGAGGMGVVYKAYDPELARPVALKLVHVERKSGPGAERARARLVREARVMAKVSHPNVIVVHDVGTFAEEVFIAMEFVEGISLGAWCREEGRTGAEVLRLFIDAGRGLAAAHRLGLIHRDFKPENAIVGEDGRVRVLDFGLARVMADGAEATSTPASAPAMATSASIGATDASASLTAVGAIIGTPAYMSPEAHRGHGVDERSDQFSFCVSLWEALYGRRPFAAATVAELADKVAAGEVDPPPPSARVAARIKAILVRGMSAAPEARFAEMDVLLAELGHDAGAARRRILAAVVVVALAAVAVFGLLRGTSAPPPPCQGAERVLAGVWDADTKTAVKQAFLATDKPYAHQTLERASAALDGYANTLVAMRTDSCEATRVRGSQSEHLLDLRARCLARRRDELGALTALFVEAPDAGVLDKAVRAVHALTPIAGCADVEALSAKTPPPEDPRVRQRVESLRPRLEEARARQRAGQFSEALGLLQPVADEARTVHYPPLRAEVLLVLGDLLQDLGRGQEAEQALYEAAAAAASAADDEIVAKAWMRLVYVLNRLEASDRALTLRRHTETAVIRAGGGDLLRAEMYSVFGGVHYGKADYAEAHEHFEESLALYRAALGPDHLQVSSALNNVASALASQGKLAEATSIFEQALAIVERALGRDHPTVGAYVSNLGIVLMKQDRYSEALKYLQRALDLRETTLGPDHPSVATTHNSLGNALSGLGEFELARKHLERAREVWSESLGPESASVAKAIGNLGTLAKYENKLDEALEHQTRAVAIFTKALGADHPSASFAVMNIGGIYQEKSDCTRALRYFNRALGALEAKLPEEHPAIAETLNGIGWCRMVQRQLVPARAAFERSLAILEPLGAPADSIAEARFGLARTLWAIGDDRRAARALAESARDGYKGAGRLRAARLRDAVTWLAEHRLAPE